MTPDATPSASPVTPHAALDGPDVFASRSPWSRTARDPHDARRHEGARRFVRHFPAVAGEPAGSGDRLEYGPVILRLDQTVLEG